MSDDIHEEQISVRLPKKILAAIDKAARQASSETGFKITRAAMVRRCIESFLAQSPRETR